jgi:hypothetical protein
MDIELPFDFKEFLKLLNENGVRYLLIGDIQKLLQPSLLSCEPHTPQSMG